jgi:flagellar basal-body rod modification protein FlgD
MAVQAVNNATAATTTATTGTKSTTFIDKNAFLNLLVSQLKYQDPLDPMKADQFMSQLAQMTQVEQLQNISESLDSMNKAATSNPTQWVSTIGKKINVDSTLLSNGDQVYLTPGGDYDKATLTLKNQTDGSTSTVTFNKGDSLAYTYDGSGNVAFAVSASKNGQAVGCTASAYQIVRGIQVDTSGATTLVSGTGESYTVDKVKQIIQ